MVSKYYFQTVITIIIKRIGSTVDFQMTIRQQLTNRFGSLQLLRLDLTYNRIF